MHAPSHKITLQKQCLPNESTSNLRRRHDIAIGCVIYVIPVPVMPNFNRIYFAAEA